MKKANQTFWLWRTFPVHDDDVRFYGIPSLIENLQIDFSKGLEQSVKVPTIEFTIPVGEDGNLNDNISAPHATGLMVSRKLREVLELAGVNNISWYPVVIRNESRTKVISDYQLGNIVGRVACVDYIKSELQFLDDGRIQFIDKLVLRTDVANNMSMFRLEEFLPLIVVDDKVKEVIEAAGCTGMEFWRPEELVL